jgi:hypothetical protein
MAALIAALGWRGALGVVAAMFLFVVAPLNAWALRGTGHRPRPGRPRCGGRRHAARGAAHARVLAVTAAFTLDAFVMAGLCGASSRSCRRAERGAGAGGAGVDRAGAGGRPRRLRLARAGLAAAAPWACRCWPGWRCR